MKVKFTAEAKKIVTVAEVPEVKKIISYMKEIESRCRDSEELPSI